MEPDSVLELVESLVYTKTGRHLNDLQRRLLKQVWQGRKYLEIAQGLGYTEGHIKDVAADLWQRLSEVLGERVTKGTLRSALERWRSHLKEVPDDPAESEVQPTLVRTSSLSGSGAWVGRANAIADLNALTMQGHQTLVIQGEGGLGKTTLALHFLENYACDWVLELLMAKERADILPVERVVEEWLTQDFGVEPGREFGVTLGRLKRQLAQHRVAILIDNLEPALNAQGCFVPEHARYRELLRVLTDTRHPTLTLITSRDRLCEPGIRAVHYRLPSLSQEAWAEYFQQRHLILNLASLTAMHRAYGGNAKAMEILGGTVQADFEGDMATYWQQQGQDLLSLVDLKNLVESQVCRLQSLDPDAYRIFCRLGAYRYQAVPTIPVEAIVHLMADLPPESHQGILASLRNRSLVECRKNCYWLHPVVRAEAIARLRRSPDWELANRQAADFWTHQVDRITSLDEALEALEAYYHYFAIADYAAAARVILHSRDNQWRQFLPLGSTLYRMGLIQPAEAAITAVLKHIPKDNSDASELYNILGDLYWITGRIQAGIHCQENALQIAQACLAERDFQASPDAKHRLYYLTMLAVDSRLSLGLYALNLWDLPTSATLLHQVIDQAQGTAHQRWADKATICLALVQSYQGQETARQLADAIRNTVLPETQTGRFAFFIQLLGQTYVNLEELTLATELFQTALAAAEAGHYIQIKANVLSGLGQVERLRQNWQTAIAHHQDAIALLEDLGAKGDLAEAHYQLGLTYQAMELSEDFHFQIASHLFREIQAPYQVKKVEQAGSTNCLIPSPKHPKS